MGGLTRLLDLLRLTMRYRIEKIVLEVPPGEVLDDMYQQACFASLEHRCDVEFIHNDRLFGVDYRDLINTCGMQEPVCQEQ